MVRPEKIDARMGRWMCNIRPNDQIYAIELRNRLKLNTVREYEKYTNYWKHLNGCSLNLMNKVFYLRQNHYKLLIFKVFATDNLRKKYLLSSSVYRVNQLWQTLPSKIKRCSSLQLFKD